MSSLSTYLTLAGPPGPQGDPGPAGPAGAGSGDVLGPASVTANNPVIWDGTTGDLLKESTYAAFKTALSLVKGDVGLGNVDNTSDANKPVSSATQTALDLKANLASPTLTGTPAAPTAAGGTNTTQIATTAFVTAALAALSSVYEVVDADILRADTTKALAVGYTITVYNAGSKSTGTFTPSIPSGNLQYAANDGAHTLAAPTSDGTVAILYTNGVAAGAITFSGFTVGTGKTGDALTTTSGHKFLIQIVRINSVATYTIKALQ